ncbi:MAG: hypothetical protein ABL994_06090 [Verrucomicrobiales bacterium]
MKKSSSGVLVFSVVVLITCVIQAAEKPKEPEVPKPPVNIPAAILDIANSKDGDYPGESTPVAGKWTVDAGAKKLNVATEPLLDSWLEFGPEIREKAVTIVATGGSPGEGRLKSRFGVGLYGKNGFQLRAVPARQEIELVRRGAVLLKKPFELNSEDLYSLELSVIGERSHWIVSGRIWKEDSARPAETMFQYKIFADELLVPLAGRSVLVATPFSGEPVSFSSAKVYYGEFVNEKEAEKVPGK